MSAISKHNCTQAFNDDNISQITVYNAHTFTHYKPSSLCNEGDQSLQAMVNCLMEAHRWVKLYEGWDDKIEKFLQNYDQLPESMEEDRKSLNLTTQEYIKIYHEKKDMLLSL